MKNKPYYIVLGGEARSGKDESSLIISELSKECDLKHIIRSLAQPIKDSCPSTDDKEAMRLHWQDFGGKMRERFGDEVFAVVLKTKISEFEHVRKEKFDIVIVPDLRLPAEFKYFRDKLNSTIIKIVASEDVRKERFGEKKWREHQMKAAKDVTELGINAIPDGHFDKVITNNGTLDELRDNLLPFIKSELKKEGIL